MPIYQWQVRESNMISWFEWMAQIDFMKSSLCAPQLFFFGPACKKVDSLLKRSTWFILLLTNSLSFLQFLMSQLFMPCFWIKCFSARMDWSSSFYRKETIREEKRTLQSRWLRYLPSSRDLYRSCRLFRPQKGELLS